MEFDKLPKTPRTSPRLNIIKEFKKTFFKTPPMDLGFPTSLSPISTMDHYTHLKSSDYSPTPTISSSSSYFSSPGQSFGPHQMAPTPKKGPKIKPYVFSQSQQLHHSKLNKSIGSHKCFICDELIQSKLDDENILELKCGDFVHEQCLKIQVGFNIDRVVAGGRFTANREKLSQVILPICGGKSCEKFTDRIEFVDEGYFDVFLNLAISKSIEYDRRMIDEMEEALTSFSKRSNYTERASYTEGDLARKSYAESSSKQPSSQTNNSIISTQSKPTVNLRNTLQPPIDFPLRLTRGESMFSYLSSIQSGSPTPTLSTISNLQTASQQVSVDDLKDNLLQNLMRSTQLTLATLSRLGNLRLADNLLVKRTGEWEKKACYLFDKYLVITSSSEYQMVDLRQFSMAIENGWVKIMSDQCVWLNASSALILEKWCIGLLDCSFSFPAEILTSTLTDEVDSLNSASTIDQTKFKFPQSPPLGTVLSRGSVLSSSQYDSSDDESDDDKIAEILARSKVTKVDEYFREDNVVDWGSLIEDVEREIHRQR